LQTLLLVEGRSRIFKLTVLVGKTNEKVSRAKVSGEVVSPTGISGRLEEDITDNNGQISYTWRISGTFELGIHTVNLDIIVTGYCLSITISRNTFEVI
jgi:hypothetical protein